MASRKSKAERRKAAYGAPAEEREVVVIVDKRLLIGASLLVVFALAVGISALAAARGETPGESAGVTSATASQGLSNRNPVGQQLSQLSEEEARSAARAQGLPDNVTIVGQNQYNIPEVRQVDSAASGSEFPPDSPQRVLKEMADEGSATTVDLDRTSERLRDVVSGWTHDVLAGVPDPNVTVDEYKVYRVEDISKPLKGPRLGIEGLNTVFTYNFGYVLMDQIASTDLVMKNVGDEPLRISRVYSGCGCTAPRIGDIIIDEAGWLTEELELLPGETIDFTVEFDPQLAKETKAQAKWLQIFSNDDSKELYDPTDPLSHETRFRIVVQPTYNQADIDGAAADEADE